MSKTGKYRSLDLDDSNSRTKANPFLRVIAFFIDVVMIRLVVEFVAFSLARAELISERWMDVVGGYLREGLAPLRGGAMSREEILIITSTEDLTVHILYSALFLMYFILLESRYGWGQTIGKKILSMEVLDRHSKKISLKESSLRNIPKYVLRIPVVGVFFGLFELFLMFYYLKRTGDILANTDVVSQYGKGLLGRIFSR